MIERFRLGVRSCFSWVYHHSFVIKMAFAQLIKTVILPWCIGFTFGYGLVTIIHDIFKLFK